MVLVTLAELGHLRVAEGGVVFPAFELLFLPPRVIAAALLNHRPDFFLHRFSLLVTHFVG